MAIIQREGINNSSRKGERGINFGEKTTNTK